MSEYVMSWKMINGALEPVAVLESEYDESQNDLLNGTVKPVEPKSVVVKAKKEKKAKKPRYKRVEQRKPRDPELKGKMIAFYEAGGYTQMTDAVKAAEIEFGVTRSNCRYYFRMYLSALEAV